MSVTRLRMFGEGVGRVYRNPSGGGLVLVWCQRGKKDGIGFVAKKWTWNNFAASRVHV